ncbi:MAG: MFS transporter [Hyphomicrobium sp.]|nr:MFS transporter [Hyphomicrobium sp.]
MGYFSRCPEVDLIANASFSACIFVIFVGQFSKIAIVVFGALYLQDKLGMSPLTAGLALLASVAAFPFLSAPVGRLADKYAARPLVLSGIALATLAMFWLGFTVAWDSYVLLLPGLIGWGLGMPLCYAPALRAMANSVPLEKQGQASGIGVTSRLLGGAIGMAVGSSLLVTTGSFEVVFLATAGVMLVAVLFGFFAIERRGGAQIP